MSIKSFLICLLLPIAIFAQNKQDTLAQNRKSTLFGLPVVYNAPETSWAFGLAGIYSFYTDKKRPQANTRPSQFQLARDSIQSIVAFGW